MDIQKDKKPFYEIKATRLTAFLTGGFTVLSLSCVEGIISYIHQPNAFIINLLFFSSGMIFFFLPALIFVVGRDYLKYRFGDILKKEYWVEFGKNAIRALFWFLGATLFIIVGTLIKKTL